jgi:hypothetical protein
MISLHPLLSFINLEQKCAKIGSYIENANMEMR